ncbi:MAG: ABC transporter permease [Fimbriimonadaceae bacterium]
MNARAWWVLAKGVVLEALRRKDLWVVGILGALIVGAAGLLGLFGITGLEAFAKDLAVGVLGLFSTVMAVLSTARLMPKEIGRRTLYPLLARPISRLDLLLGKLFGAVLVSWAAFLLLCLLTGGVLLAFRIPFEALMLQYVVAKMMGLVLLCGVTLALSCWMTPQAAATLSLLLAFGSPMVVRALVLAHDSSGEAMRVLFRALNATLPQYSLFDLGGRVANFGWPMVPAWVMGWLAGYAAAYTAAMLVLAWVRFQRQAV